MTSHSRPLPSYQQATKLNQVGDEKTISERDKVVTQEEHQWPWENTARRSDLVHIDTTDIIWVPAAKHPQIAPNEFLEWIKTHGGTTPYNKNPVKRQRSTLSTTYTSSEEDDDDDDDDDNDDDNDDDDETRISLGVDENDLPASSVNLVSPIDTITTNDTNLPELHQPTISLDTSPVLATQEKSALSRRKALSSRAPHISRQQISIKHTAAAKKPSDKNNFTYDNNTASKELTSSSSDGIRLYDQPVDIHERVDLGNVIETEACQPFLHGMHAAETHVLTQQLSAPETSSPSPSPSPSPPTRKRQALRRSVSDRFSWTPNGGRKSGSSSWIRGFFTKHRVVDDSSSSASLGTFIPTSTPTSQVSPKPSPASLPLSSYSSSSSTPTAPMSRSSSHNLISYLSRKLSLSPAPFSSIKPEKQTNQHPRRRYSNFLLPSRHSTRKQQVTPIEIDRAENEQRLPIHLERGVYRLSHMKLANPRRSLREQVIISNFMFWYLTIINMHPQQQQQQPALLDNHVKSTTNHPYTNDTSSSSYTKTQNSRQLEKPTSSISDHSVHMPLKRPPTGTYNKDFPEKTNFIPTIPRPASPLALKNKKDKYKPIKNVSFGKQIPNHTTSTTLS